MRNGFKRGEPTFGDQLLYFSHRWGHREVNMHSSAQDPLGPKFQSKSSILLVISFSIFHTVGTKNDDKSLDKDQRFITNCFGCLVQFENLEQCKQALNKLEKKPISIISPRNWRVNGRNEALVSLRLAKPETQHFGHSDKKQMLEVTSQSKRFYETPKQIITPTDMESEEGRIVASIQYQLGTETTKKNVLKVLNDESKMKMGERPSEKFQKQQGRSLWSYGTTMFI